jgi:hypothetical protein
MARTLFYATRVIGPVLVALSCRETSAVSPEACNQDVQVAVVPGASPVFSWSPACGMSSLSVVTVPSTPGVNEESVWGISVSERTPIGPAIRYGIAPAGATVWTQPHALVAGATYRVRVMQTVGGDVVIGRGERLFTP